MFANVGTWDRVIRFVVGAGIVAFAALSTGSVRWVGVIGIVLIATAVVKFCPAYWVLRIRTLGGPKTQRT